MSTMDRRELLRWVAVTGGVTCIGGCSDDGRVGPGQDAGHDDAVPPDSTEGCRATTNDALGPFFEDGAPMRTELAAEGEPGDRLAIDVEVLAEGCVSAAVGVLSTSGRPIATARTTTRRASTGCAARS
jgi:hypothetical protein